MRPRSMGRGTRKLVRKITLRLEPSGVMPITETRFRKAMFSSDPLGVGT